MKCFVIMPFGNPQSDPERARKLELIYTQWIKPTVEAIRLPDGSGIECHRGDKDARPGEIITHIIENLVASDIVIADLSGRNPNVFYELGVRHAVNNKTILIAEDADDIPFDLRGLRAIVYRYDPEQMLRLRDSLEQAIGEILKDPERIDNPVRRYLYEKEVNKLMSQATPPGYDVVKNIVAEMASLKLEVNNHLHEVRHIIKLVTENRAPATRAGLAEDIGLEFFEGIWKNRETGSTYCARVVNGELYMPYCYHGDAVLTGHYYNLRVIGGTLFGRFKWFNSDTAGYFYLKVAAKDRLVGGWWLDEYVPREVLADISRLDASMPLMTESRLYREPEYREFPGWAEEYFRHGLYQDVSHRRA